MKFIPAQAGTDDDGGDMRTDLFDFPLPPERIALRPARPRDAARLLVVRSGGTLEDRVVRDLPELLQPGDQLVVNDTRVIRPPELGGYGLDAQWNDDFHHSLHTLLTREREGYYVDFGVFQHMAQAFSEGFVYSGHYSVTRNRRHGNSSRGVPPVKFIAFDTHHGLLSVV